MSTRDRADPSSRRTCGRRCWHSLCQCGLGRNQPQPQRRAGARDHPARHLCQGLGLRKSRRRRHRQDQRPSAMPSSVTAGRIVFTRDVTFSSSSLVNRYFDIYDPPLRDYLQKIREGGGAERLLGLIDKCRTCTSCWSATPSSTNTSMFRRSENPRRKTSSPPCSSIANSSPAACIAAANHVASFCKSVEIVTTLGGDDYPLEFIQSHHPPEREADAASDRGPPDHPQAALCRARISAQAVRSLHDGRHAARAGADRAEIDRITHRARRAAPTS